MSLNITLPNPLPLSSLEKHLISKAENIENWFQAAFQESPPPFYTSVDLRRTHYKISAIDTNLFPAGFNNLSESCYPYCEQLIQKTLGQLSPTAKNILLIPENHTRNPFYFQSLSVLMQCITHAGYHVACGSLTTTTPITQGSVTLHPIVRTAKRLSLKDFDPDIILLNNDLSAGLPEILIGLEQSIFPPPSLGWHQRLKSSHFLAYETICNRFSEAFDLDPWQLSPYFRNCGEVNFMQKTGQDCIKYNTQFLLDRIKHQYKRYKIEQPPFVFIKADAGTYGMGIMRITDIKQLDTINRKQRTHMAKSKDNQEITKVIIQEGVYTDDSLYLSDSQKQATAEPVIYLFGQEVAGAFYRLHHDKSIDENLNTPGMRFEPLARSTVLTPNRFQVYATVARLAALAAAIEIGQSQVGKHDN